MKYYTVDNEFSTSNVPAELTTYPQWVCWRWEEDRKRGKWKKVPINPATGRKARPNDPGTWGTLSEATTALLEQRGYGGVGFMLTREDPYTVIDLDGCRDPDTGEVEPWALEVVRRLASMTFVSPRRTGLHIWVKGTLPVDGFRWVKGTLPVDGFSKRSRGIEGYSAKHYMTFTGKVYSGDTIQERQEEVEELYRELHPEDEPPNAVTTGEDVRHDLTDEELLEKARSAETTGATFTILYDVGYTGSDHSAADAQLMRMLAYWTGKDPERMERLFSESALGRRGKWKNRPDYRERTIRHAIKRTRKVYDPEYGTGESRVRRALREKMAYALFVHKWKEKTGRADSAATDFFGYRAVLRMAWKANREEVSVSVRQYAEEAGIASLETATKSIRRLSEEHGLLKAAAKGGPKDATTYRIEALPKVEQTQIDTGVQESFSTLCLSKSVPLLGSHLVRNTSPEMPPFDKNGRPAPKRVSPPVESVGKVAAWVLDLIHTIRTVSDEPISVDLLNTLTGIQSNHLKERPISKLLDARLIEQVGNGYVTPDDIAERLNEELEISFSKLALRKQKKRHDEQRKLQRVKILHRSGQDSDTIAAETGLTVEQVEAVLHPADPAPTVEDMREWRAEYHPDGEIRDLEKHAAEWDTFVSSDETQQPISVPDRQPEPATAVEVVSLAEYRSNRDAGAA